MLWQGLHFASVVKYSVMNTADKMAKMATATESTTCFFDVVLWRHLWQLFVVRAINRSGEILLGKFWTSVNDAEISSILFGSGAAAAVELPFSNLSLHNKHFLAPSSLIIVYLSTMSCSCFDYRKIWLFLLLLTPVSVNCSQLCILMKSLWPYLAVWNWTDGKIKCAINYVCTVNVLKVFHLLSVLLEIYNNFMYYYFDFLLYLRLLPLLYRTFLLDCFWLSRDKEKQNLSDKRALP